jgi:hypothetical protein
VAPGAILTFAGISWHTEERAHDGTFPVCSSGRTSVDANADLVISFAVPPLPEGDSLPAETRRLLSLLAHIQETGAAVARLRATQLDPAETTAVAAFQEELTAVDQRIVALVEQLTALGVVDEVLELLEATRERQPDRNAYGALADWLRARIQKEEDALHAFLANRDRYLVQVVAFKDPREGKRVQLHVQNYDELPIGELQPIDRYGLRLSPAERERLQRSLDGNQAIADLLGDVQRNRAAIVAEIAGAAGKVRERIAELEVELLDRAVSWKGALTGIGNAARDELARNPSAASAGSVRTLASQADALRADLAVVDSLAANAGRLRTLLDGRTGEGLSALLLGEGGIVATVESLAANLERIADRAPGWVAQAEGIGATASQLPAALLTHLPTLHLAGLDDAVTWVRTEMPITVGFIERIAGFFRTARRSALDPADELAGLAPTAFRSLDDLPDATIELERAGWAIGDRVTVVVRFHERGPDSSFSRLVEETQYRLDAILTGGHREVSSALIFSRALQGNATQEKWKPNVAAMAAWHHHFRTPGWFGRAWNAVDPALGLHIASLDQTNDSVEFGLGVNLTVWRGLLAGGLGFNLSRSSDHEYVFVGIDLYDVLNRATQ